MWTAAVALGLAVAALAIGGIRLRRAGKIRFAQRYLERFERLPAFGAYREGLARASFPGPKRAHAVLLLHGFSAAPSAFLRLTPALDSAGIAYYAPTLTGFGLDDFRQLETARGEDWRRDAFEAFDLLAAGAQEVSIVALSFSTLIAVELARDRPVKHLVLVAPYFHLRGEMDRRMRDAVSSPWKRALALALVPWVVKPVRPGRQTPVDLCDAEAAARFFQYPALPLSSLMAVWAYPRATDFRGLRHRSLNLFWGEQEQTADVPTFLADLDAGRVAYVAHPFPASGHNLLDDRDGPEAAARIAAILAVPPPER